MRIRAHAIREKGGLTEPFSYERDLGRRDVLVRITHCSVARGDIQYIDDDWGDARFPLVPGHEIVGTEQLCPGQKVIAVDRFGGFADHILVDGRFAFRLPEPLDSPTAAPLLSSGLTVFAGILRARLAEPSQVAVLGAGGLGHLAIQFLHRMGHRVSALSHSPGKRELIERLGGTHVDTADPEHPTRYRAAFDLILSTLNVPFDLDACVTMLKPRGQLCLVASPVNALPLHGGLLSNSQRSIYGNYIGSRADTARMLQFAAEHGVAAIVEVMPFSRINEAIERVRRRDVAMGLVLENRE
jgi:D-arabinose 1-dehydrogenase-like Zn-dependent alcohol dehydrogenase